MKYRPAFPERFASIEDARAFCQAFFAWYNSDTLPSTSAIARVERLYHCVANELLRLI